MKRSSIRLQYNAPRHTDLFLFVPRLSGIGLLNKQLDNFAPV